MPHASCRALVVGATIALLAPTGAHALTTPPGERVAIARHGSSAGILTVEVDGPRCINRRRVCRRYATDALTIRCMERFGCFTGPRLD